MRHSNAERAEIKQAVIRVLSFELVGYERINLVANRVLAALKLVQDRQRRRRKAGR